MTHPYLSIVVPAYNEADRIVLSLDLIATFIGQAPFTTEVIVANDGSTDGTSGLVASYARRASWLRPLDLPHRGKGHAVKHGMLAAHGDFRFLADADLSMPIELLTGFLPPNYPGYDLVIGSREAAGARRIGEPSSRHVNGRIANAIIQAVAVPGVDDTQCGFKLFHGAAADRLFNLQTMDGFGFDVEILFLARKLGLRYVEHGIDWYYMAQSKVRPVQDNLRTLQETLTVRLNDWRGRYQPPDAP